MTRRTRLCIEALEDRRTPSFSPAASYSVGAAPSDVVSADFNGDGNLDLATANADGNSVSVLLGNGDGTFQLPVTSAAADTPRSLAVGDFNADGKLDLAMVNAYALGFDLYTYVEDASNGVSVMLGNGDGSFQAPGNVPLYHGAKATSVAVGDFNNDGTMDLAVASETDPYYPGDVYIDSGLASVLLGHGDGTFHLQAGTWIDLGYGWDQDSSAAASVAVADFNGDGDQDFVVGTRGYSFEIDNTVELVAMLLGDGQGNIAAVTHWRLDQGSMAAGDLDGDGDADLVTANGSDVRVRLGNGAGGFESPAGGLGYTAGVGPTDVSLGDFNHDGKLDVATANSGGGNVSVLRGLGNGTFGEPDFFAPESYSVALTAGDFNRDGWLDVATANGGATTASVLINDQTWGPVPPSVGIGDATVTEGDSGTVNVTLTLTLSKPSAEDVTVQYTMADITAVAGSDYVAASGAVTVPAGQTSKTFTVAVMGDIVVEWTEQFAVNLTAATNASIADNQGVVTILDDEPRISISDARVTEGNTGTVNATFAITLSKPAAADVTVQYDMPPYGSATSGNDYVAASGTITIPAGQTGTTVTMAVVGDRLFEPDEYFYVTLSAATNAMIADGWGMGTILDDEPRISINNVTKKEGNANTQVFTFTVTLSAAYDQAVTVSYATADGTATAGEDYVAKSGLLTFAPGETAKTITVVVKGDKKKESDETFFVNLSGASGNAMLLDAQGIGTILNDDR